MYDGITFPAIASKRRLACITEDDDDFDICFTALLLYVWIALITNTNAMANFANVIAFDSFDSSLFEDGVVAASWVAMLISFFIFSRESDRVLLLLTVDLGSKDRGRGYSLLLYSVVEYYGKIIFCFNAFEYINI